MFQVVFIMHTYDKIPTYDFKNEMGDFYKTRKPKSNYFFNLLIPL